MGIICACASRLRLVFLLSIRKHFRHAYMIACSPLHQPSLSGPQWCALSCKWSTIALGSGLATRMPSRDQLGFSGCGQLDRALYAIQRAHNLASERSVAHDLHVRQVNCGIRAAPKPVAPPHMQQVTIERKLTFAHRFGADFVRASHAAPLCNHYHRQTRGLSAVGLGGRGIGFRRVQKAWPPRTFWSLDAERAPGFLMPTATAVSPQVFSSELGSNGGVGPLLRPM